MPGSKISCNSFYMYMLAVRQREEALGKKFPRGLDDVVPLASYEWYHLPQETKQLYKEKAREYKSSLEFRAKKRMIRSRPRKPKTKQKTNSSSDDSFIDDEDVIFYDPEDETKFYRRREHDRNSLKAALTWNLGGDYLAKIQNYYETPNHDYMPAEIGLVEFSLMKGIINQYNVILKPINIPDLSRKLVTKRANETHQILPECLPKESRNDYRAVVEEIKSFYAGKQTNNQFRVFSLTKQFNSVQGAIKRLRDKTNSKCLIPAEKISNVEDLFVLLCAFKGFSPQQTDLMGFEELLIETNWDYEPHTLCPYHNWRQSKYCALAIAMKMCYYLFERLKDIYGLNLTNCHIPPLPLKSKYRYPKKNRGEEFQLNDADDDEDDGDCSSFQDQYESQCCTTLYSPPSKLAVPRRYEEDNHPPRVCREFEFDEEHSFDRFFQRTTMQKKANNLRQDDSPFCDNQVRCSWKEPSRDYGIAQSQPSLRFPAPPFAYGSHTSDRNSEYSYSNCMQSNFVTQPFSRVVEDKLPEPCLTGQICSPTVSNNYGITGDYFALHSLRPPFARSKISPPTKPILVDSTKRSGVSSDVIASKFSSMDFPAPPPRYTSGHLPKLLKAPDQSSHTFSPPPFQNVYSSFDTFSQPTYLNGQYSNNSTVDEIRRPTTKSLCAQLMDEKRARMAGAQFQ